MKRIVLLAVFGIFCARAEAAVLYEQTPDPSGGYYKSSWWAEDGSNYDEYVWDRFVLASDAEVDSIQWRGAYDPAYGGDTPILNFTVAIYGSSVGGSEPDVSHPPLVEYDTGDNCGQTYAGVYGGATMYDYSFALPASFHAQAGVPYWVQIEGWQGAYPGWSLARGIGPDNHHFLCQHLTLADAQEGATPTGCWFTAPTGDTAFSLRTAAVTGAEEGQGKADFALIGALPNPSHEDRLEVWFRLPSATPAELTLFDVQGRQVAAVEVGPLGPGPHVVDMAAGTRVEPGIYFARLTQGDRSQQVKVTVTR